MSSSSLSSSSTFSLMLFLLMILFAGGSWADDEFDSSNKNANNLFFTDVYRAARLLLGRCWERAVVVQRNNNDNISFGGIIQECLKRRTLIALERIAQRRVIALPYNIQLIKTTNNETRNEFTRSNARSLLLDVQNWKMQAFDQIIKIFETHTIRIPLSSSALHFEAGEGRGRRGGMMPLMLFGIMAMAIIAIPLGFQFLAVLGGKALLLAKLALILTSIQGLKKIATSDFNYGFYHTTHDVKPWGLYDRRWYSQQPHLPPPQPPHHIHNYDGYEIPDQQLDLYHHQIRPRISEKN